MTANHADMYFNGTTFVTSGIDMPEAEGCDFVLLHWDEINFQHYDAVFNVFTGLAHVVSDSVRQRFLALHDSSDLCAAFKTGDLDTARSLAASLLFRYRDNSRLPHDDSLICTHDGSGAASSTAAASATVALALGILPTVNSITNGSSNPISAIAFVPGDVTPLHGADEVPGDNVASDAEPDDHDIDLLAFVCGKHFKP